MARAYYQNSIIQFLKDKPEEILGELSRNHNFSLEIAQKHAWMLQIKQLKTQLSDIGIGEIFFEFTIPRMGKRADVILNIGKVIFVIEYKVGSLTYDRYASDQALDYALDLKNFHAGSHKKFIVPIVIASNASNRQQELIWFADKIAKPLFSNGDDLAFLVRSTIGEVWSEKMYKKFPEEKAQYGFSEPSQANFEDESWSETGYKPTPTIIEAAQALYQGHTVEEIARADADVKNLTLTTTCINEIIEKSRNGSRKSICFVTGVPGAGKTLAGLNISTQKFSESQEQAVFLSGNGPLVAVLREALARDEVLRQKAGGKPISKQEAARKVNTFIQNVHHFRDEGLRSNEPPEHVVVFDEAQRAWNQAQAEKFMAQKKGIPSFGMSEPEFLISVMDRRDDWCTVICLVGGGQEINTGEAGLVEWFHALKKRFSHWDVYHSGQLLSKIYNLGENLHEMMSGMAIIQKEDLHLGVSIRSFRAEKLSEFVSALIDGDAGKARELNSFLQNYPLVITRDINQARQWLKKRARGTERLGLVASSGAIRLKPEGIMVKAKIDPVTWFLNGKEDIRSSYYLEDVATEFDVQGLELDWIGMCWDADFRREANSWKMFDFKGTKWQSVKDSFRRIYLANAYRVLLTRARQGMVIFVPRGDDEDMTRPTKFYDETYEFLKNCGISEMTG